MLFAKQELVIVFQNAPLQENGVNGITQEILLAVVRDRLESFQRGPFACAENESALDHVKAAIHALELRTRAWQAASRADSLPA